jgi:hypothetical protein
MKAYQIKSIPEKAIIEEIHDSFNDESFEDDSFLIGDHLHAYFFLNNIFYRNIKSPFYLSDILSSGTLSEKKKHKPLGALKLFCLNKEVLYVDRWALQYDNQKKVPNLSDSLSGDYKFYIESPSNFLKNFSTWFGPLKSIDLIQFSSRFNQLLQQDLLAVLVHFPSISTFDVESVQLQMLAKLNQRYAQVGIKIQSISVNVSNL